MDQVEELERAILERAHRLADEYRQRAVRTRDTILSEANEKLKLREEREVLVAKALAERNYRQQVQSNELQLRSDMDQTRWNLVQGVLQRMEARLEELVADEAAYLPLLREYLRQGSEQIEEDELVAEINRRDYERFSADWGEIATLVAPPHKTLRLSAEPIETIGGVRIRTPDNRIRIDNTFEGRRERLAERLHQVISERLLPGFRDEGMIFTG